MDIPHGPADLSPGWLTGALRETGTIQEASVLSFQADALSQDKGVTGQLARLTLEVDFQEEGAPRTLIAKFPIPRLNLGREVLFYQQIADQIEMRTPRCYYADDKQMDASVLLLEDLAPARSGGTNTLHDLPKVEHAVRELARMHAAWWEDPRLEAMDWLRRLDGAHFELTMKPLWDPFLQQAGNRLPDREAIGRLRSNTAYVIDHIWGQPPRTLLHGDFQSDNLFFATPQGGVPFAVIDWQGVGHGRGTYDVAFYLCRGAPPQERRAIEMRLLEIYHTALVESGVQGYTLDQCIDDYRLSMLSILARTGVIIGRYLHEFPQLKHRFLDVCLPRSWAAVSDLHAVQLLPA